MSKKRKQIPTTAATTADDEDDSDDMKTPAKKRLKKQTDDDTTEDWFEKYKAKSKENLALKQNLLAKAVGVSAESNFPNIEEFVQEYKVFMNQTHNNLLNQMLDILDEMSMEQTESVNKFIESDEDIDMESEQGIVMDLEAIKAQKMCYQILFNVILDCYQRMRERKLMFYDSIATLLHTEKDQNFTQKISMFADVYLQQRWDTFVTNQYYKYDHCANEDRKEKFDTSANETNNFNHTSIDGIIGNIYERMNESGNGNNKYNKVLINTLKKSKSKQIYKFIAKCCVIFWILILNKQQKLDLTHHSFWVQKITNGKFTKIHHSIEEDLMNEKEAITYCGIPGVIVHNKCSKENEIIVLIQPHIFIHDDAVVMTALKNTK